MRARAGERRPITAEGQRALAEAYARAQQERSTEPEAVQRLASLAALLDSVEILPVTRDADGGAGFGCTVTVRDDGGKTLRYRLVGPDEADARQGALSIVSPLGRALLGCRVGQTLEVERPSGLLELEVLGIEP